jgi:signal transduction histidine kinase/ActR/RegA family two-component response regulator
VSADALVTLSAVARWFTLVASVIGLPLALLSFAQAHRIVRASADDDRHLLARFARSSEALSVAAQLAFVAVAVSFVSFPPAPPNDRAQVAPFFDGILRTAGFGLGALVLALKSLLNLVVDASVARPRSLREAAHVAELEAINRRLEQATQAKSDFLANMSHELRTPLNAVLGFSELLDEQAGGVLNERQRHYLSNIGDAGRHLLGLINDVLDLSKVEAGRLELRPGLVSLSAVLEPIVSSTRTAADRANVRFDVSTPDEVLLGVDAGRIRQILYNLLSNAVKFTPQGGSVELVATLDGRALDLSVSDSGIGIPPNKRDKVFGTFERLHEGSSAVTGTGLGLALTKRLVELHHGTIAFNDREGGGTIFCVHIPDAVASALAGDRLLVVEDERRDADLIVALAARSGMQSEVVTSVDAAMAAIWRSTPRAVVLDLRLAGERGERVLEMLKGDPATRAVPVVVVTVEDDDGRSRMLGADDHITKPIDHDRLRGWLEHVAARSRDEAVVAAEYP